MISVGKRDQGSILFFSMDKYHMSSKVRDEITCLFLNFNGVTVEVWEWISNLSHI